ncbi:CHAT domain-containing protein [Cyanobium sp. Morenito 9A2]|nr:CHAT domain-containing protein [Cyanobium sp. Morenito 9A2]
MVWIERTLGPDHPFAANALSNLAFQHLSAGALNQAEPLFRRALLIVESTRGQEHPDTAAILNNLGVLYNSQAALGKAQPLLERALTIRSKVLGPEHPDTLQTLNNLAGLTLNRGAATEAEPLLLRVLALRRRLLGELNPDTAQSFNNLASLYERQGQYARALPHAMGALSIWEQVLGPEHPQTAMGLNNLAMLHLHLGADQRAEPLLLRALAIRRTVLGENHPDTLMSLNNMAFLLERRGAYARSESFYREALAISEKILPPEHPDRAQVLNNLAALYDSSGQPSKAVQLLRRGLEIQTLYLQREIPLLPETQRLKLINGLDPAWEVSFSYAGRQGEGTALALFSRLNRHGLLQDIERRQALLSREPGAAQETADRLIALLRELSNLALDPSQRQLLLEERNRLESQLYLQLPALQPRLVQSDQVAKALPADGALVEFQRYRPFEGRHSTGRQWGPSRYLALILLRGNAIHAVDLGPTTPLEDLIRQALAVSEKGERPADPLWQQVSNLVLGPLLPQLSGWRRWFLSPDGELNRLPFAALPAPGARPAQPGQNQPRLAETVQLRLLTSGRDLLKATEPTPASGRSLVLAAPDFGGPAPWAPLPATLQEGVRVADLLGATLITGTAATPSTLQQARGPRVLHVASHGFFRERQGATSTAVSPNRAQDSPHGQPLDSPSIGSDPLLDSGLVLAGANRSGLPNQPNAPAASPTTRSGASPDDGYLTAKEAAQLQLDGTQLVVLSACDTGSGTSQGGEGVYGLQRALTVAGARSTLLSLWKVDDAATARFMQRFYDLLKAGKGRMDALVQVQEEFRTNPPVRDWRDHRYWAAWQLSGDDAPLQGL